MLHEPHNNPYSIAQLFSKFYIFFIIHMTICIQISFSEIHPLIMLYFVRRISKIQLGMLERVNKMNFAAVLGTHCVNDNADCYTFRAVIWLDTDLSAKRFLEIFNRYPITELTVHPRVRKDFYKEPVREEWFRYAYENSKNPLCYNGNIMTRDQADSVSVQYSGVDAVMIGRALIADPGMLCGGTTAEALEGFLGELTEEYIREFGSARNAMFRLKENWGFLRHRFENSDKLWKQLRKTTDIHEYNAITAQILHTLPLTDGLNVEW